jgi:hypothetical protein
MLKAIVQMCWDALSVPKGGFLSILKQLVSVVSVKQGDHSPLLFGAFIDEFEQWLHHPSVARGSCTAGSQAAADSVVC